MVPSGSASRQVLIWSVPTLVILLSLVWYRRKRNTLRTDPGGTSDSATKAKAAARADKQTNGFVHPGDNALPEDLVTPAVPEKEAVKSVVQEAVPEKSVVQEAVPEKSVVQEAVPEKSVVQEAVPEKSVVEEAVPEKKSVVEEAVPEKKSVVEEAVLEKKSVVSEAVPEKKSVVQEAVLEKSVVKEAVPEKSVVPEAFPKEVKKQEPVPKPSVVAAVPEVEEQLEKPVVKEEEKPSVVQEEKAVKKAVPKEVEEQVVAKKVAKEEKKPSAVQGEKKVAKKAVPKEVEEQVVVKKVAKVQGAVPKVEEAVVAKKEGRSQESVPAKKPGKKMSEEEVVSEGAAAVDAAAATGLQEEKVGSLGGKLASLTLEEQRADADRDSANHSPVDAMLASPSLSNYSDEHSEGSSDSGKGCSDVASPPSRTPLGGSSLAGDAEHDADVRDADVRDADVRYTVYEFLLPHYLVGRLIGPRGSFVQEIKSKTNATVQVKKHPELNKQKICVVDGTQSEVDAALAMIRDRYPIRKFPVVTLEQVSIYSNAQPQPMCALIPEYCQLHLVEGVNNEVMVSCMVSPGHMFLQQPYHPTFQYLTRLSEAMNSVYSHADAPHVPEPITVGSICVAPATEGWYRVQVVSIDDESHSCEVKFVDHGGYMTISNSSLRQIHHDFMSVPFQATECFLANIKPPGGSNVWSEEAVRLVDELTRGKMLYAQVYDYTEYCIPLVYLYCCINSLVVLINQELVARGLAELDDVASTEPVSAEAAALVAAAAEVAPLTRPATETPSEVEAVAV